MLSTYHMLESHRKKTFSNTIKFATVRKIFKFAQNVKLNLKYDNHILKLQNLAMVDRLQYKVKNLYI